MAKITLQPQKKAEIHNIYNIKTHKAMHYLKFSKSEITTKNTEMHTRKDKQKCTLEKTKYVWAKNNEQHTCNTTLKTTMKNEMYNNTSEDNKKQNEHRIKVQATWC